MYSRPVDQWANRRSRLGPVTNHQNGHPLGKFRDKGIMHIVLHQYPIGTDASLSGIAELGGHQSVDRRIKIGIFKHDEGSVATKFKA